MLFITAGTFPLPAFLWCVASLRSRASTRRREMPTAARTKRAAEGEQGRTNTNQEEEMDWAKQEGSKPHVLGPLYFIS